MSTSPTRNGEQAVPAPSGLGVAAIALGAFALVVTEFLPIGLLPGMVKGLGISEGTAGLAVTVTAACGFISAPVTALSVGRLDRRIVLLGLSSLVVISSLLSALAPNFELLLLARVIIGIGVGGFWAISIPAAARLVPTDKVHKASSLVFAGISVATVVTVPMGSFIATHYDWRVGFIAASVLSIAVFLLQLVALPRIAMERGVAARDFLSLLKSRRIVAIYLAIVFCVSGQFAGYTFVTPYLMQLGRFDTTTISVLLFAYGLVAVVGNFIGGTLAGLDLHKTVYGNVALFLGALLAMSAFAHSPLIATISLMLWAVAWGMTPVGTQLWLFNATKHAPEAAQSMNTSVFQLSITLGSLMGSVVVDHINLHASMWLGSSILALAMVMVIIVGCMDAVEAK
ncbi:MFS transporter [Paraburkholderia sp. C35]|uniref:MFS transporter n=1 Tax=Paraburkholderia sp. C35 TaxID=2126993 RepID=UPI000D68F1D5|nr:MFS transporter [Paraburkholderia sp. C35]